MYFNMDVRLRDLRAFEVLAEELHFGRAAVRLHLAQPNLSAMIRRLEDSVATRLFVRTPRVELTDAGRVLQEAAANLFVQLDDAVDRARIAGEGRSGVVRVGFASTTMLTALPDAFRAFRADNPGVELQLREMHSAAQWDSLKAGTIDVAITRELRPDSAISSVAIVRERFAAVLPVDHRLAASDVVAVPALATEPFVTCRRAFAPVLHDQITAICADAGFAPSVRQEADEWHTVFGFVRAGFGVSLAPDSLADLSGRGVVFRPLDRAPVLAQLHLCWPRERASPVVRRFVEALKQTSR